MNLESVPNKQLHQIEQLAKELADVLTKAKLQDEALCQVLVELAKAATTERQSRFDEADTRFKGF